MTPSEPSPPLADPPGNEWPREVALVYEGHQFGGEFDASFLSGLQEHGCRVTCLPSGEPLPGDCDLVLAYGPFTLHEGNLLPIARQLDRLPADQRPRFAFWLTEGIPNPSWPRWFVEGAARMRVAGDRLLASGGPLPQTSLLSKGHRLRIYGQLRWAQERGLLAVLAVTSSVQAGYLRQRGFDPIVVPLGYYKPGYGHDMALTRDIDVAFLGNTAAPRRARIIPDLAAELGQRGIQLTIENNVYDEARNRFLNRTRLLLNILRAPQDFVGQRYLLAAANKSLVISEPVLDCSPFIPGEHLVVSGMDKVADKVEHFLDNEDERLAYVDRAYRFVTTELTIGQMIGRILDKARLAKASDAQPLPAR